MRKKIFSGFMLAVAATAGIYAHLEHKQSHSLTALQLRNAEALTESEFDAGTGVNPNDLYGYDLVNCIGGNGYTITGAKCEQKAPEFVCNSKLAYGCD